MRAGNTFAVFGPRRANQHAQATFVLDQIVAQHARIQVFQLALRNGGERRRWGHIQQQRGIVEQEIQIQQADAPGDELRQADRQIHR